MTERAPHFLHIQPQENNDLEILQCGMQECDPDHEFGPAVRGFFLIHYIVSGQGVFDDGHRTYHLKAGDLFLIRPGELTVYRADGTNPWQYIWVGFAGEKAPSLLEAAGLGRTPVLRETRAERYFRDMIGEGSGDPADGLSNALRVQGELLCFFGRMAGRRPAAVRSVSERVADFLRSNAGNDISITRLAADFGYSRTYFNDVFKKETGRSPGQYLLDYRLRQAVQLLETTDLKITHIARSVGYEDALYFSRLFREKRGMPPSAVRRAARRAEDSGGPARTRKDGRSKSR